MTTAASFKETEKRLNQLQQMYAQLLSMARMGLNLLERNALDEFQDIWAKRESLFGKATVIMRKLGPSFEEWEQLLEDADPQQAEACRMMIEQIRRAAEQILDYDEKSRPALEKAMENISGVLQNVKNGKKLIRAYNGGTFRTKPPAGFKAKG